MVTGLDKFREHFVGCEDAFVLIGGAACDIWFARFGGRFRATKDIDMVLVLEAVYSRFIPRFWQFIKEGDYEVGRRSEGHRTYFRFAKPAKAGYPRMMELFSAGPLEIEIQPGQRIVPIPPEEDLSSLSAILMDRDYYDFIMGQREVIDGLPVIKPAGLIVLKARAWHDLAIRRSQGDVTVKEDDVNKHRTDVFRLATLLPVGQRLDLDQRIRNDVGAFVAAFPVTSPEWPSIRQSLESSGIRMTSVELIVTLKTYFQIPS